MRQIPLNDLDSKVLVILYKGSLLLLLLVVVVVVVLLLLLFWHPHFASAMMGNLGGG